jgi:hypothetical protein
MANANGKKFGLTALFPIKAVGCGPLRVALRAMNSKPYGSPLSDVNIIHMARFAIINTLAFEGIPAKRDLLQSNYLLFMCDFDGTTLESLVTAMVSNIPDTMNEIWGHCIAYPGLTSRDQLTAYFERCQLETNLFLADRPDDEVDAILRGLLYKREFAKFVAACQNSGHAVTQIDFITWWQSLRSLATPKPGSM